MDMEKPNPGTEEALALGCECPVMDNHYGKGVEINGSVQFWYSADCPVHSPWPKKEKEPTT